MDVSDLNDEYVRLAQEGLEALSVSTVPGVYWVEHFPPLRHIPSWVPGTSSKKMAEYYKPIVVAMRDYDIKKDMVSRSSNSTVSCCVLIVDA